MRYRGLPLALSLVLSGTTSAAPPAPSASASPERGVLVRGADVPEAASAAPSLADWAGHARVLAPNRGDSGPCKLSSVREWVRVECPTVPGAGLVAGNPSGVDVRVTEGRNEGDGHDVPVATTLIFPLRRGAALVFSLLALGIDYNGASLVEGGTLSVVWRTGKPDPVLAMHGVPPDPSSTPGAGDGE